MNMFRGVRLIACMLAAAFLCMGCSFGGAKGGSAGSSSLLVGVSDASDGTPVARARVQAQPLQFFVPAYPFSSLGGHASSAAATTDETGTARLTVSRTPLTLVVAASGHATLRLTLEPAADGGWLQSAGYSHSTSTLIITVESPESP
ncbi:MAG: hypothetical protein ACR2GY_00230 [Phycisphaerales bacterium]